MSCLIASQNRSIGFATRWDEAQICSRTASSETSGLLKRTSRPFTELIPTPVGAPIGLSVESAENSPKTAVADSRVRTEKHTRRAQLSRVLVGMLSAVGRCVLRITMIPADRPRLTKSRMIASISAAVAFSSLEVKDFASKYAWHSSTTTMTAGCSGLDPVWWTQGQAACAV